MHIPSIAANPLLAVRSGGIVHALPGVYLHYQQSNPQKRTLSRASVHLLPPPTHCHRPHHGDGVGREILPLIWSSSFGLPTVHSRRFLGLDSHRSVPSTCAEGQAAAGSRRIVERPIGSESARMVQHPHGSSAAVRLLWRSLQGARQIRRALF